MSGRIDWDAVLARAAVIVDSYDTGVTLRQLFYRLVAAGLLDNTTNAYKMLSSRTAQARRLHRFPALIDRTRSIHRDITFTGVWDASNWLADIYRRDRTEGQDVSIYLGVEKNGIVEQLRAWFGHLGLPILALGGFSSQSYVDEVSADVCPKAAGRRCCFTLVTTTPAARISTATSLHGQTASTGWFGWRSRMNRCTNTACHRNPASPPTAAQRGSWPGMARWYRLSLTPCRRRRCAACTKPRLSPGGTCPLTARYWRVSGKSARHWHVKTCQTCGWVLPPAPPP